MAVINDEQLNGAVRFLPGNEKPLVGCRAVTISSAKSGGGGGSESRSGDTQRREREREF